MKNNKGFTLIEIIIVVALISLTVLMFSNSFDGILSSQSSTAYERFTNNVSVAAETYLSASIEIKNEMETLELSTDGRFQDYFIRELNF